MSGRCEDVAQSSRAGVLTGAFGGAFIALAGHAALLQKYGTVLPYRDQWKATAVDILQPWLEGSLTWRSFFEPLNDHWPVLTRALSYLVVRLNGQWNNLVETSINALLFASSIAVFLMMLLPGLRGWTRPVFALLTGAVFALPITWENTLWGIQSLVYLQIGLSLLYFAAVCSVRTFSIAWWCGHAAGAALLLTQHSAILAHIAVALLLAWRGWRGDGDRRVIAAGFGFALAAIILFIALFPSLQETAALRADSWAVGLDVFLRQLAWPLPHPAWAFIVYLPWLAWIATRLTSSRMDACDAFIFVVGLWIGAQAAAIGYGRGAATYTFVSRYCDFLALGFLLNAACLVRLSVAFPTARVRAILAVFALIWVAAPIKSFHWESIHSHAGYNLSRRTDENARNLAAVRTYLQSKDASLISDDGGRGLYSYPPELLPLLDNPGFQELLPPETGSTLARSDHGRLGWIPALLLPGGPVLASLGLSLIAGAALFALRRRSPQPAASVPPHRCTSRGIAVLFVTIGIASGAATLVWQHPATFDRKERLRHLFLPAGAGANLTALQFTRGDGNDHPNVPAAAGALETMPPETRAFGYGTRLPVNPDFRGILHSQSFRVSAPFLVIPFTGFPCANGNGLRWRFFNPTTQKETWISYLGPNPGANWDVWTIESAAHLGEEATLYLYDGREDESGWVGVGQPTQTQDGRFGSEWLSLVRSERTDSALRALAGLSVLSLLLGFGLLAFAPRRVSAGAAGREY